MVVYLYVGDILYGLRPSGAWLMPWYGTGIGHVTPIRVK